MYRPEASHDGLRDPGKFLTLDTKLLTALTTVARGELAPEILIFKETEAAKNRVVRGRQVLYLFDQYFKTSEEVGSLYSVEDLLKVRLVNDDLSTFLSNWESVISGLSHMPDETNMRDIFLRELRQSKKIKHDLEIYDRAKEGSEQHTSLFLKNSIKEMLTRERKHKNRDRIAPAQGDKYGAAASPRSASPSRRGGHEKPQSSRGSRPRSPGRGRSQSPNKPRTPSPKGVCYDFLKGIALFSTRRDPFPQMGQGLQRKSTELANSGKKGHAPKVINADSKTRMLRDRVSHPKFPQMLVGHHPKAFRVPASRYPKHVVRTTWVFGKKRSGLKLKGILT